MAVTYTKGPITVDDVLASRLHYLDWSLLKVITKTELGSALEEEVTEHLGYEKHQGPSPSHDAAGPGGAVWASTRARRAVTKSALVAPLMICVILRLRPVQGDRSA